jgi:UDP-N-acetylmuramate--alanine ligase
MKEEYHFIGIGGIGMSGLPILMLKAGMAVSGSDLKEAGLPRNSKNGAKIFVGHKGKNISGQSAVVYSSAIKEDN